MHSAGSGSSKPEIPSLTLRELDPVQKIQSPTVDDDDLNHSILRGYHCLRRAVVSFRRISWPSGDGLTYENPVYHLRLAFGISRKVACRSCITGKRAREAGSYPDTPTFTESYVYNPATRPWLRREDLGALPRHATLVFGPASRN